MINLIKGVSAFGLCTLTTGQTWSTVVAPAPSPTSQYFPTDPLNSLPSPSQSITAFGNVKTIANDGSTDGTVDIFYEYYSSPFAAAQYDPSISPTNPSTTTTLTLSETVACSATCTFGDVLDGGESLSTKDILVGGVENGRGGIGAAYVFKDVGFRFTQQAELFARDGSSGDLFGQSVGVDEFNPRKVIIGAPGDDDNGSGSGSAYMFESSPTAKYWTEGQKLLGAGTVAGDNFGSDVDIMGRLAVVTAPGDAAYSTESASACEIYLFEQELPKPSPPPPDKCAKEYRSSRPKSLRGVEYPDRRLPSAEEVIGRTLMRTVSPFADIRQTKTLQWSQQQILHDSIFMDDCQGDLQISLYEKNLVVGIQFYDDNNQATGKDAGIVLSFDLKTFRGPCTSNIFPTMLSFSELVEMRDAATRSFWEEWGSLDGNSTCKPKPPGPKPVPMCEVSRWSMNQVLRQPVINNCSYYGSAVDVYGDIMVVQERGYDYSVTSSWPSADNCQASSDPSQHGDGVVYIYQKVNGKWSQRQMIEAYDVSGLVTAGSATQADFGNSVKVTGTDIYANVNTDSGGAGNVVFSTDQNYECAVFSLGDQFGDGWNGAELVITQQDGKSERYAPYCSSVNSGSSMLGQFFRWCPHNQTQCGEITLEIPRAEDFPFHWEIIWGVYMEETDVWVYGDHKSKMVFNWDCDRKDLSLVSATHVVNNGTCVSNCQKFQPTPRPTIWKPPPSSDPKPKPTPLPTGSPVVDNRRLLGPADDADASSWGDVALPDLALQPQDALDEGLTERAVSHVARKLPKSKGPHTQHPTISPAPTLLATGDPGYLGHYEYITLSATGSVNWFAPFGRSTMWYLTDIHGKHLIASGMKCSEDAVDLHCWLTLPPNGDFILRIGGNENPGSGVHSAQFCHKDLVQGSQLTFRISDHQCTPLSYYTTSRYCSSYLKLVTAIHGVALFAGVHVSSLSQVDMDILSSVFASIYGSQTGVEVKVVAENSAHGTVVTFELYLDIRAFGYDKEDFDAVETVPLLAQDTLSDAFETGTFAGLLDMEISSHQLRGMQSSFRGHGAVELRVMSGGEFVDMGPSGQAQLDPISFVTDSGSGGKSSAVSAWFEWPAFLAVLCVGVVAMAVLRLRRTVHIPVEEGDAEADPSLFAGALERASGIAGSLGVGRLYTPVALTSEHGRESTSAKRSSDRSSKSSRSSKKRSSSKDSASTERGSSGRHKGDSKARSHKGGSRSCRTSSSSSSKGSRSRRQDEGSSSGSDDEMTSFVGVGDVTQLLQESSKRRLEEQKLMFRPTFSKDCTSGETVEFDVDTLVKALAESATNLSDDE